MPAARYWANIIGSWMLATLMGVDLKDTQSGFRVVRTDVLRQIPLEATGYEFETELVVKLARDASKTAMYQMNTAVARQILKSLRR